VRREGLTLTDVLVAVVTITLLMAILMPALGGSRQTAIRLVCQTNLTGIGRTMTVFANENNGRFPRAGGPGSIWTAHGKLRYWDGGLWGTEDEAFGIVRDTDGEIIIPGKATVTSSFFLLVKYEMATPKLFVCKGDAGAMEFKMSYFPWSLISDMNDAWDFGDGSRPYRILPGQFVSYTYHLPYSKSASNVTSFGITDVSHPASPVCADRNPFMDKNAPDTEVGDNSASHRGKGQNVLYRDGSVRFETKVNVGIAGDNIYTYATSSSLGGGDPNGTPPAGNGRGFPFGERDAYLVGEQNYR
jgi:type II secretory pathway pseudopilin PulG